MASKSRPSRLTPKAATQAGQPGELAVGDGHAVADAGGGEPLAVEQHLGQLLGRDAGDPLGERRAQLRHGAGLVLRGQRADDGVGVEELGDLHAGLELPRFRTNGQGEVRPDSPPRRARTEA
jgi:hypothetical protein